MTYQQKSDERMGHNHKMPNVQGPGTPAAQADLGSRLSPGGLTAKLPEAGTAGHRCGREQPQQLGDKAWPPGNTGAPFQGLRANMHNLPG